ncbi:MAG: ribosome-recycling factor, partial [Algoriella sp.]
LGISPANDGNVIRLVIPQLTEERRKELAKKVGKEAENAKVSVRNIRREAMDELKKAEKNNEITQDDLRTFEEDIQKITNESVKNIDAIA